MGGTLLPQTLTLLGRRRADADARVRAAASCAARALFLRYPRRAHTKILGSLVTPLPPFNPALTAEARELI